MPSKEPALWMTIQTSMDKKLIKWIKTADLLCCRKLNLFDNRIVNTGQDIHTHTHIFARGFMKNIFIRKMQSKD